MGQNSRIEWTTHTFNPWIGCQHVSDGCENCYAETGNKFRKWTADGEWGPHAERSRTVVGYWKQPARWNRAAAAANERRRVFCASLADWLDNQAPQQWRLDLADVIAATPHLDWLMLTKRIENFDKLAPWPRNAVPSNVWIGTTCEDQPHFDRRWRLLHDVAAIRFVSYEPAIGPLALGDARPDWTICGGESGSGARTMDPQWARDLRDECAALGIAFFMKQMTGKRLIPDDLTVRQFPRADR